MKGFLLLTEREEADAFLFVAREYGGGVLGVVVVSFGGGPLPRSYAIHLRIRPLQRGETIAC